MIIKLFMGLSMDRCDTIIKTICVQLCSEITMNNKNKWVLLKYIMMLIASAGTFSTISGCDSATTDSAEIVISPTIAHLSATKGDGVLFAVNNYVGGTFSTSTSTSTNGNTVSTTTSSSSGTNQTLYYPLEWSVSSPSLGYIKSSTGRTAIYESLGGAGNNTVSVRDQDGKKGQAVVVQTAP